MSTAAEPQTAVQPVTLPDVRSLSMEGVCKTFGVSRRTVYYWIQEGRVQTFKTPMGSRRVLTESLRTVWSDRA